MNLKKLVEIKEAEEYLQDLFIQSGSSMSNAVKDYLRTFIIFTTAVHSGKLDIEKNIDVVQYSIKNQEQISSLLSQEEIDFVLGLVKQTILLIEEGKLTSFDNYYEEVFEKLI